MSIENSNASAQRKRLLDALQTLGAVSTIYARDQLNIMMPATRVHELRKQENHIHTELITITDRNGNTHRKVASYTLIKLAGGNDANI